MESTVGHLEKILIWYVNLLEEHFERSLDFYDTEGSIYHKGEYGRYREDSAREFIQFTIPGRLSAGEGFIANSCKKNKISTQCDIIVYDKSAPQFKDSHVRIFPIETVVGIGEVKSTLKGTQEITDALVKLAKNKAIRKQISLETAVVYRESTTDYGRLYYQNKIKEQLLQIRDDDKGSISGPFKINNFWISELIREELGGVNTIECQDIMNLQNYGFLSVAKGEEAFQLLIQLLKKKRLYEFDPSVNHTDHIMSFLICYEIKLKNKKRLMGKIEEAYDKNNIPIEDRHNMILSIKDGLFLYYDPQDKENKDIWHWAYPKMKGQFQLKQRFIPKQKKDEFYHFKVFSQQLFNGLADTTILHPEPASYYDHLKENEIRFLDI